MSEEKPLLEPTYTCTTVWNRLRWYGTWLDGEGNVLTVTDEQIAEYENMLRVDGVPERLDEAMAICAKAKAGDEEACKRVTRWYYDWETFG